MSDITLLDAPAIQPPPPAGDHTECQECLGTGGWFRYEPALDPTPGMLYLSCMECRGSGRTALLPRG